MSGPGISATYAYNGLDARRGKTMNGVSRSYLRDGAYVTDPLLHDGEAAYTPGASVREYGATKYLHSGLKSADAQSNTSQTLTATRLYDAFGNVDSSSGSWTGALGYGGPYGYQSASEGGLMLLGHRYYDPSTGRFLTRDPAKYGASWYVYAENDPVRFSDPVGQWPIDTVMDVIGIGMSLGDVIRNPRDPGAWIGLVGDVGAAFTPYVPGSWIKRLPAAQPKLPRKVIGKKDGVTIEHYYPDDHGPARVHVIGGGRPTKVGQNAKPIKGYPELSRQQKAVLEQFLPNIRKAVTKIIKYLKYMEQQQ